MKIIFLDIDGVMNTHHTPVTTVFHNDIPYMGCMDQEKVFMINNAVDLHGFKVVLSSTWRMNPRWRELMKANGFIFEFFDLTPNYYGRTSRGTEIADWIKLSGADKDPDFRYAIIDDNGDMLAGQGPHFFKTEWGIGLTEEIMNKVILHLNCFATNYHAK